MKAFHPLTLLTLALFFIACDKQAIENDPLNQEITPLSELTQALERGERPVSSDKGTLKVFEMLDRGERVPENYAIYKYKSSPYHFSLIFAYIFSEDGQTSLGSDYVIVEAGEEMTVALDTRYLYRLHETLDYTPFVNNQTYLEQIPADNDNLFNILEFQIEKYNGVSRSALQGTGWFFTSVFSTGTHLNVDAFFYNDFTGQIQLAHSGSPDLLASPVFRDYPITVYPQNFNPFNNSYSYLLVNSKGVSSTIAE